MKFIECLKQGSKFDFVGNNIEVKEVKLYKNDKILEISFSIDEILKPEVFLELKKESESLLTPLGLSKIIVNVEYKNSKLSSSLADEYFRYITKALSTKNAVYKSFIDLNTSFVDGLFTIVVDRATNLSYPNRRIIAVTNGTKTVNSRVIPVNDAVTANNIMVMKINFLPNGFTAVTILSSSFL